MKHKILFIKNNILTENISHLKYLDISIDYIFSFDIIDYNYDELNKLIDNYTIIIIGGGPQHLTFDLIKKYPEIDNLIKIVKIVQSKSKLLIGICLGCQIIGYTFGFKIVQMPNLCFGFDFLDINSINNELIKKDTFLSKMDFNIISKSFSYHYDCIKLDSNNELNIIAKSISNIPYIIKHKSANIYGFQFHPEISFNHINHIFLNYNINFSYQDFDSNICKHFFEIFINN